jgi:hypothetical protein
MTREITIRHKLVFAFLLCAGMCLIIFASLKVGDCIPTENGDCIVQDNLGLPLAWIFLFLAVFTGAIPPLVKNFKKTMVSERKDE